MRTRALIALLLVSSACATIEPVRPDGSTASSATTTLWNGFEDEELAEASASTQQTTPTTTASVPTPTTSIDGAPVTSVAPEPEPVTSTSTTVAPFDGEDAARLAADAVAAYGVLTSAWFANDIEAADVAGFLALYNASAFVSDPAADGGAFAACYAASYPPTAVSGGEPVRVDGAVIDTTNLGAGRFRVSFDLTLTINGTDTVERNVVELSALGLEPDDGWGVVTDCAGIVDPA